MWCVYKIYYGSRVVYVGRTDNIERRMRQHLGSGKLIDVLQVSKIEYSELDTESDMNLYELYYILKLKPELNEKDFATDELLAELPELEFRQYFPKDWEDFQVKARQRSLRQREDQQRLEDAKQKLASKISTVEREILQTQVKMLKIK